MEGTGLPALLFLLLAAAYQPWTNAQRLNCADGDPAPATRVNTTDRLARLRANMATISSQGAGIEAFIVFSDDAHFSEYPTDYDKRRGYISGFSGSAGTAVITQDKAALWTDGRYFLEADEALDCNWLLMKAGLADTPSIEEWLNSEIQTRGVQVGVDKSLISNTNFLKMSERLQKLSQSLVLKDILSIQNPVDAIWTADRPARPTTHLNPLPMSFAGKTWQDKVTELRVHLAAEDGNVGAFVVTGLDETAWLFNIRGNDISYNPFFLSYAIVETSRIRLYILDKDARLGSYPDDLESDNVTLAAHLNTSDTGTCQGQGFCVEVYDYSQADVEAALVILAANTIVWVTPQANYGIYSAVSNNFMVKNSPIAIDKSIKNAAERNNMRNCYNRDSATLIQFLAFFEEEIKAGNQWTEMSAAAEVNRRRNLAMYSRGLSFETISSYGSNGAIIHYRPSNITNKAISTDSLFLLDSGGQYLDGTTDVTRTMHYGEPTAYEKECYTRVLASAINLALLKWPEGLYGRQIDAIARYALWDAGLVYHHGTGHGIGAYLSVHEGPGRISLNKNPPVYEEPLMNYQYYSDEPGYYEGGKFGIRLETIVTITPHTPKYTTANERFFAFTPVTLVPFETNLIDTAFLTDKQIAWLNDYNALTRKEILPLINSDARATTWLNSRTEPMSIGTPDAAASMQASAVLTLSTILALAVGKWMA